MKRLARYRRTAQRRRGAVIVQVAVSSTVMLGMAALAVDVGMLYTGKVEVQNAADSAALAAASRLSVAEGMETAAIAEADKFAAFNHVMGNTPQVFPEDVEFGGADVDFDTGRITFDSNANKVDAVRVTVRHAKTDTPGVRKPLATPLAFANIFGISSAGFEAKAAAVLVPRDIAVVIDLSNSMTWDSELRFWNRDDGGFSNLRDIWCALNGPSPSTPYIPGAPSDSEFADDTGPTYGYLDTWGTDLIPGSYSTSSDPGLWYIKKSQTTNVSAINTRLNQVGYKSGEQTALKSGSKDGTASHWRNRCGVLLGLATWKSGKYPARFSGGGDGDDYVEDNEVTWVANPSFAKNWNWKTYVDWVQSHYSSTFKYRYGLKTFTDFLIDSQPESYATGGLAAAPQEPLRAIKDAVQAMTEVIIANETMDQMSLEVFASTGKHELGLTDGYQTIPDTLYERQSGHYDRTTNIGAGLQRAIEELTSERARKASSKVIVLMSDGVPNCDEWGNYYYDGAPQAVNYAYDQAEEAADHGFRIYCVSVGVGVDRTVMQEIADIGRGVEFYAAGTPAEYTTQLETIFRTLGGARPVALIE